MDMGEPAMDIEPEMDLEDEVEESLEAFKEGPCDIAKPEEIEKMSGVEYDKYAQWKKDCESDERTTPLSTKRLNAGNEFSGELAKAKIDGKKEFKVDGKKYKVEEDEEGARGYIVFHSKKGKFETHADTSYEAATKAAKHWKLKSTAGVSAHLVQDDKGDEVTQVAEEKAPVKAIDTIKQIVADTQNMQVKFDDGKMRVDLYTASAVSQVYDAVKPETQAKMDNMLKTKAGMLKMSSFAFSSLKEAYAGTDGVSDKNGKIHDPKSPKAKMIINMKRKPDAPAVSGTGSKLGTAKAVAGAVGGGIKKVAGVAAKAIGGAASRSGFGNPLSASKYSESKAESIMSSAIDQSTKN
jgi:hypothetical protein